MIYTVFQKHNNGTQSIHQVVYDETAETLNFMTLKGTCADFSDFLVCLTLGSGIIEKILLKHFSRKNDYEITSRDGRSGCTDYRIRWQTNEGFIYQKKILHTSMYGSLNEGISIWMGDLQVLLFTQEEFYHALIKVEHIRESEDFDDIWHAVLENPVNQDKKYAFATPCSYFLEDWANPSLYNSARTIEDTDNEIMEAQENYPECWAIWKLIGERKGYKEFFTKDEEEY